MTRTILLITLLCGCWGSDGERVATDAAPTVVDSGPLGYLWYCGCPTACHTDTSQPVKFCADRMAMDWTVNDLVQKQCRDFHNADGRCRCGLADQVCERW